MSSQEEGGEMGGREMGGGGRDVVWEGWNES